MLERTRHPGPSTTRRPDVCLVVSSGADGGVEKCVREYARFLADQGAEVVIVSAGGDYYSVPLQGVPGIRVIHEQCRNDREWSVGRIARATRLFLAMRPRAVILFHSAVFHFRNATVAVRLAGVPRVVAMLFSTAAHRRPREHARHWLGLPGIGWWWHWFRVQVLPIVWLSDSVLFATACHAADFHRAYEIPPRKAWIVPHLGVDGEEFQPRPELRPAVRAQYGVSEAQVCVVYAGRLSREKAPDLLLGALVLLPSEWRQRMRVLIAGDGGLREELAGTISRFGLNECVKMVGRVTDVPRMLAAADVVVVPSRLECFGLSLVEAMASGCAVIASALGGIREIVADGQTGLLFEPGSTRALADCLLRLLESPELRDRLARNARPSVLRRYSKNTVCRMVAYMAGVPTDPQCVPPRWGRTGTAEVEVPT